MAVTHRALVTHVSAIAPWLIAVLDVLTNTTRTEQAKAAAKPGLEVVYHFFLSAENAQANGRTSGQHLKGCQRRFFPFPILVTTVGLWNTTASDLVWQLQYYVKKLDQWFAMQFEDLKCIFFIGQTSFFFFTPTLPRIWQVRHLQRLQPTPRLETWKPLPTDLTSSRRVRIKLVPT